MARAPEPPRPPGDAPRVVVELDEHARVVPGGHRKRTWLVRVDRDWVPALRVPGAAIARADPGVGTVWEHSVRLELAVGCELVRIDSEPAPRARRDALSYLERGTRETARRVTRISFRVRSDGRLQAASAATDPTS